MIEYYTQLELLDEGFWDKFVTRPANAIDIGGRKIARSGLGRTIGTIGKTIGKVTDTVLPELTAPIKQAWNAGAGIVNTAVGAARSPESKILKVMKDQGISNKDKSGKIIPVKIQPVGKNYLVTGFNIDDYDTTNPKSPTPILGSPYRAILDVNGQYVKNLRFKAPNQGTQSGSSSKTKPSYTTTQPSQSTSSNQAQPPSTTTASTNNLHP